MIVQTIEPTRKQMMKASGIAGSIPVTRTPGSRRWLQTARGG